MATLQPIRTKRIKGDIRLLQKKSVENIDVYVDDDKDALDWSFIIYGPMGSDYEGGEFIGKMIHSHNYPMSEPDFMMLTPNGRFDIDKKICPTNSGFHAFEWSPSWTIQAILRGFLLVMLDDSIMILDPDSEISHTKWTKAERQELAKESINYNKMHHKELYEKIKANFIGKKVAISDTNKDEVKKEVSIEV